MEIQVDANTLCTCASAIDGVSSALAEPAVQCENALEAASRATHDQALSSVMLEISDLAKQAHDRLSVLVSDMGTWTAQGGNAPALDEDHVAPSAGND